MASLRSSQLADLTGRVALVTGGGTGIGQMIARGLASNGARVYIAGRRERVLLEAAEKGAREGLKLIPLPMDVTDKVAVENAEKLLSLKEGKLHILVNNAGTVGPTATFIGDPWAPERKDTKTFGSALFQMQSSQDWNDVFELNVSAIFFCTVAFMGLLEEGARDLGSGESASVINISSAIASAHLSIGKFAYASSKAAVNHLTRMMATDLALLRIPVRVNAIAPGYFPSELAAVSGVSEHPPELPLPGTVSPTPVKRPGRDEEMAMATLSIVAAAGYTNGQILTVDGGYSLVNP